MVIERRHGRDDPAAELGQGKHVPEMDRGERRLPGHEDERTPLLIVTSAARSMRLEPKPLAMEARAFMEQGITTMASTFEEPLAMGAYRFLLVEIAELPLPRLEMPLKGILDVRLRALEQQTGLVVQDGLSLPRDAKVNGMAPGNERLEQLQSVGRAEAPVIATV